LTNVVDGRSSVKDIGKSLAFTVKDLTSYSVRIVTKAGNSASINIGSLSTTPLQMMMFVIPPTLAPGGGNVTILMSVTNNYTDVTFPRGINASMSYSGACTPTSLYPCTVIKKVSQGNNTLIPRGSTAFYKWVYNINSPDGTVYTFTGKIVNGVPTNTATASVTLKLLDANRSTQSGTTDVLSLKFLSNVGLSLVSPGPFGTDSSHKALWGVVVSNPTGAPFDVSKVSISLSSPPASGGDNMVTATCSLTPVQPTGAIAGTWSCPSTNVIQWVKSATTTVQPYQSLSFMIEVNTGNIQSTSIPATLVTATAFTTYGQFSKVGYSVNMEKTGSAMANIFFSTKNTNSTAIADMIGHLNGVSSNSLLKLNVTLTDFETAASPKINSGARVIVNLPPGFQLVSIDKRGGYGVPTNQTFSDSSVQIIATRTSDITGTGTTPAGVFSFTVRTPTVLNKWIYIITVATDGTVDVPSGGLLGASAEFGLQVNPP
jgi:hypothetical protein